MKFSPGLLQTPLPLGNTILSVKPYHDLNKNAEKKTYCLWDFITLLVTVFIIKDHLKRKTR